MFIQTKHLLTTHQDADSVLIGGRDFEECAAENYFWPNWSTKKGDGYV